jgi:hypothetical protein
MSRHDCFESMPALGQGGRPHQERRGIPGNIGSVGRVVGANDIEIERIGLDSDGAWIDVLEPDLPPTGVLHRATDRQTATSLIRALLSGPAANERYSFGGCGDFASLRRPFEEQAIWRAHGLARRLKAGRPLLPSLWNQVARLFEREDTWAAVAALAEALFKRGQMESPEIQAIIQLRLCGGR